jgi:transposase
MGQPIEITRPELPVSALRALAGRTADGAVVRRLLAIALVLEGHCQTAAASLNGMTRQTLRDWVHRYNVEGVDRLRSRTGPGRPRYLSEARMEELREMVLKGPDPELWVEGSSPAGRASFNWLEARRVAVGITVTIIVIVIAAWSIRG